MNSRILYSESLASKRTEALFISLSLLFLLLAAWRSTGARLDGWSILFACLFLMFLFYSLNYRRLDIRLHEVELQLKFGLFTWRIPVSNIETVAPDTTSLWRIGGAGIHFTPLGGRYRAMFNFLEYPRLVIALKVKQGLVRDIAFSTRQPEELMRIIRVRTGALGNGS
jgi:hypothetical protein